MFLLNLFQPKSLSCSNWTENFRSIVGRPSPPPSCRPPWSATSATFRPETSATSRVTSALTTRIESSLQGGSPQSTATTSTAPATPSSTTAAVTKNSWSTSENFRLKKNHNFRSPRFWDSSNYFKLLFSMFTFSFPFKRLSTFTFTKRSSLAHLYNHCFKFYFVKVF